jgi:hypothetical protein
MKQPYLVAHIQVLNRLADFLNRAHWRDLIEAISDGKMLLEWSEEGDVGCGRSSSNEGLPGISRFPIFYRDVRPDRHAKRGCFFLGKNVNTSVNGERALAPYFL